MDHVSCKIGRNLARILSILRFLSAVTAYFEFIREYKMNSGAYEIRFASHEISASQLSRTDSQPSYLNLSTIRIDKNGTEQNTVAYTLIFYNFFSFLFIPPRPILFYYTIVQRGLSARIERKRDAFPRTNFLLAARDQLLRLSKSRFVRSPSATGCKLPISRLRVL